METREIQTEAKKLEQYWKRRNKKMQDWANIITLKDNLKQKDMESVISNEPLTFFNMAMGILVPPKIDHRIPVADKARVDVELATEMEKYLKQIWKEVYRRYLRGGRLPWMRELTAFALMTGWYAVYWDVTPGAGKGGECVAEVWNPYCVYPDWIEGELGQLAYTRKVTGRQAKTIAARLGYKGNFKQKKYTLLNYWGLDLDANRVGNAVIISPGDIGVGVHEVKPWETYTRQRVPEIPVLVGMIGGLPDRGYLLGGTGRWQETLGQSIVATNEGMYKNYDKLMTYLQQLVRDTSLPRWLELLENPGYKGVSEGQGILDPARMFSHGAVFTGGINDRVTPLPVNAIPAELGTLLGIYQGQLQRGSLPHVLYGSITERMSGFLWAQVISAAFQVLGPFHDRLQFILTEVDNHWLQSVWKRKLKPYGVPVPPKPVQPIELEVRYDMNIPADLVQQATLARMLNPNAVLASQMRLMDEVLGVEDPLAEQARIEAETARRHPIFQAVLVIQALEEEAQLLTAQGELDYANTLIQAAGALRQNLPTLMPQAQARGAPGVMPGAVPPEFAGEGREQRGVL